MIAQNVYTVEDRKFCPEGKGESIKRFVEGVFSRAATKVASLENPVDWLVIKSNSLQNAVFCSQYFAEKELEDALRSATSLKNLSVFRRHASFSAGAISKRNVEEWMKTHLSYEFQPVYLNPLDLELSFVGYHLNMREQ